MSAVLFRDVFRGVYLQPLGTPLYWGDEQSGLLARAVMAYHGREADRDQMALVIEYCRYVIDAPCWAGGQPEGGAVTLWKLRRGVRQVKTATDLDGWITDCLDLGIDPL